MRWYALAYIAGLVFAVWYMKRLVGNPALWDGASRPLRRPQVDDMFVWITLGVVLGGRIGYVIFYDPAHFLSHPLDRPRCGKAACPSMAGSSAWSWRSIFMAARSARTLDRLLDLGAASTPVGLGLGRLANFINGELYGRPERCALGDGLSDRSNRLPRHPSQLYEALLEGLVLFIAVRIATHRYQALAHPGRASGIFAMGYGLSRILVEFFREPDAQIGYIGGFFTMGMILSLPLIAVGVWLYFARGAHGATPLEGSIAR